MSSHTLTYFRPHPSTLFIASKILCSPLEALFTLLIFIISKELNASLLQLTIIACAKPTVSLIAYFLNGLNIALGWNRKFFLLVLNTLGCFLSLFFPCAQSPWIFVIAYILFMTAIRTAYPIWCEILKQKMPQENLKAVFSKATTINYAVTTFLPLAISFWLDSNSSIWPRLFACFGALQLLNAAIILLNDSVDAADCALKSNYTRQTVSSLILTPWKNGVDLLLADSSFRRYLLLFGLGGAGLVAMQPILPFFYSEVLHLSYKELALAISFCKGVGFILTSSKWAKARRLNIYKLNSYVNLFSCLFIVLFLLAPYELSLLYVAYFFYGIMQAGCELTWHLSGPLFAKQGDSTLYSSLNLATVGLRGCIFPFLAQALFALLQTPYPIFMGALALCLLALLYSSKLDRRHRLAYDA